MEYIMVSVLSFEVRLVLVIFLRGEGDVLLVNSIRVYAVIWGHLLFVIFGILMGKFQLQIYAVLPVCKMECIFKYFWGKKTPNLPRIRCFWWKMVWWKVAKSGFSRYRESWNLKTCMAHPIQLEIMNLHCTLFSLFVSQSPLSHHICSLTWSEYYRKTQFQGFGITCKQVICLNYCNL